MLTSLWKHAVVFLRTGVGVAVYYERSRGGQGSARRALAVGVRCTLTYSRGWRCTDGGHNNLRLRACYGVQADVERAIQ